MTRLELRAEWTEKLHGFDPSSESFAAFCRKRELNYPNALHWKRKFEIGNSSETLEFSEFSFPLASDGEFILRRNGWEILVPTAFDDRTLRRILAVFEGA